MPIISYAMLFIIIFHYDDIYCRHHVFFSPLFFAAISFIIFIFRLRCFICHFDDIIFRHYYATPVDARRCHMRATFDVRCLIIADAFFDGERHVRRRCDSAFATTMRAMILFTR